ncbi:30S ribosomal protein S15 [Candidatus Woesearchaeota archaeon]|nr:30S ribosomal protein S15 [Candidatus Woesearchaeota archaeon]
MARMYSRKRGKSGSKKPIKKAMPTWLRYKAKEIELLIVKFAKEGKSASEIGLILRDSYGIPSVKLICGKTITSVMKEKNLLPEVPDDLIALIRRSVLIRKHIEVNKEDQTAKRGLTITESKIKKLVKYYKREGKLPSEWKYDPARAGFFMK